MAFPFAERYQIRALFEATLLLLPQVWRTGSRLLGSHVDSTAKYNCIFRGNSKFSEGDRDPTAVQLYLTLPAPVLLGGTQHSTY